MNIILETRKESMKLIENSSTYKALAPSRFNSSLESYLN